MLKLGLRGHFDKNQKNTDIKIQFYIEIGTSRFSLGPGYTQEWNHMVYKTVLA